MATAIRDLPDVPPPPPLLNLLIHHSQYPSVFRLDNPITDSKATAEEGSDYLIYRCLVTFARARGLNYAPDKLRVSTLALNIPHPLSHSGDAHR